YSDRWGAALIILHERHYYLELFCRLSEQYLGYFCSECGHFWKSVFPTAGHSAVHGDVEPGKIWNSVPAAHGCFWVFLDKRISRSSQPFFSDDPGAGADDGCNGTGTRNYYFIAHYQVPRSEHIDWLWRTATDVCYPGCLPVIVLKAQ